VTHRVTQFARGVLAALVITGVTTLPTGASAAASGPAYRATDNGSIGIRLVDVPASAGNDPRARLYIVDHLAPGTIIHRRVEVTNTTASTAHILLYAAAATIADGSFLGAAGHTPNDLSTWTSVSPGAPDVPARGHITATVTIALPHDAAPGEQYGVVWAEARSGPIAGGGVVQVNRVGIRLYVSVGPGGPPAADFTIVSLTAERAADGRPTVEASVHNTGGRALDLNGSLGLSAGPGGLSAGPFPASLGTTLAIGETEPVTITLDKQLPAGPWDAQITLRSGLLERIAEATITFPAAGAAPSVIASSTRPGWLDPAIVGSELLLLLVILALLVVLWRRRRVEEEPPANNTNDDIPDDDIPDGDIPDGDGPQSNDPGRHIRTGPSGRRT
jgi:hypothetical protein